MFKAGDKVVRTRGSFNATHQGGVYLVSYAKDANNITLAGEDHAGITYDARCFDLVPEPTSTTQKIEALEKELLALTKQLTEEATELAKAEKTYSIGQRFSSKGHGEVILAQVDYRKCSFVSLEDGNRFTDPVSVKDINRITAEEFKQLQGSTGEFKFTLIES